MAQICNLRVSRTRQPNPWELISLPVYLGQETEGLKRPCLKRYIYTMPSNAEGTLGKRRQEECESWKIRWKAGAYHSPDSM